MKLNGCSYWVQYCTFLSGVLNLRWIVLWYHPCVISSGRQGNVIACRNRSILFSLFHIIEFSWWMLNLDKIQDISKFKFYYPIPAHLKVFFCQPICLIFRLSLKFTQFWNFLKNTLCHKQQYHANNMKSVEFK